MAFGKAPDDRRGDTPQRNICSHVNHAWGEPFDLYQSLVASVNISSVSHNSQTTLTPEYLADKWGISLESAKRTITSTSHHSIRTTIGPTSKRFRTRAHQSRYRQLGGYLSTFASDAFSSKVKSLRGNNYIQFFCNRANFVRSYPIKLKSHAYHSLDRFIHEVGVPTELLTDGAKELTQSEWSKICQRHHIYQVCTEPRSPWQNHAELIGGIIKRKVRHRMKSTLTQIRLWDYC